MILRTLEMFKPSIAGVAVESTFNWYWLVDALRENGYKVYLANPCAAEQYKGLKHTDDKTDAIWLAEMLRLGILPVGYIYPKEQRSLRDLLRKRTLLVQHKTALTISLKGFLQNWTGERLSRSQITQIHPEEIDHMLSDKLNVQSANHVHDVIRLLGQEIESIEKSVLGKIKIGGNFQKLLTVWGVGEILATTIILETGPIERFPSAGHYASYCRCVSSKKLSNDKKKGSGNRKNGNKYLAWAYIEAAYFMRRFYPRASAWFDKKAAKRNLTVATKALSNKIARAVYFILRDQTEFEPAKLFG
jgi:transposase